MVKQRGRRPGGRRRHRRLLAGPLTVTRCERRGDRARAFRDGGNGQEGLRCQLRSMPRSKRFRDRPRPAFGPRYLQPWPSSRCRLLLRGKAGCGPASLAIRKYAAAAPGKRQAGRCNRAVCEGAAGSQRHYLSTPSHVSRAVLISVAANRAMSENAKPTGDGGRDRAAAPRCHRAPHRGWTSRYKSVVSLSWPWASIEKRPVILAVKCMVPGSPGSSSSSMS